MPEQVFTCRVCLPTDSESSIRMALEKAFPAMQWDEGDSFWDKVRVWGKDADRSIQIYRYESPGPFSLTITFMRQSSSNAEIEWVTFRGAVLAALHGTLWKPLEPQPVVLVRQDGRFPAAYEFDCDLEMPQIQRVFEDADFWYWEPRQDAARGL